MRALFFALLVLAGCSDPAEAPVPSGGASSGSQSLERTAFTFVHADAPRSDVLDVPAGARTLRVDLSVALSIGTLAWSLRDPGGQERWTGVTGTPDTLMTWQAEAPQAGAWRVTFLPQLTTGAAAVGGEVE